MSDSHRASPNPEDILHSLRRAVAAAIERKRRLQQYVVEWTASGPRCVGPDAPRDQRPSGDGPR